MAGLGLLSTGGSETGQANPERPGTQISWYKVLKPLCILFFWTSHSPKTSYSRAFVPNRTSITGFLSLRSHFGGALDVEGLGPSTSKFRALDPSGVGCRSVSFGRRGFAVVLAPSGGFHRFGVPLGLPVL